MKLDCGQKDKVLNMKSAPKLQNSNVLFAEARQAVLHVNSKITVIEILFHSYVYVKSAVLQKCLMSRT